MRKRRASRILVLCLALLMAAVTHGVTLAVTTNTEVYTTASFTPAADDLLVAFVFASGTALDGALSDSQSLGWTIVKTFNSGSSINTLFVANALAAASAMTVTFDVTGDPASGCFILVARISGLSRVGANAIRQSEMLTAQTAGTTPEIAFAASALTENPTLGFVRNITNPAGLTPPTNWTERVDTGYATPATGGEYVSRDSGFTGTTITWGSTSATAFNVFSVELDTSTATTEKTGLESLAVVPGEASRLEVQSPRADTLASGLGDESRLEVGAQGVESLSVGLSEVSSASALVFGSDDAALVIAELGKVEAAIAGVDSLGIGSVEASRLTVLIDRADSQAVVSGEASDVLAFLARADALGLGLGDASSVAVTFSSSDAAAAILSEVGRIEAAVLGQDSLSGILSELSGLLVALDRADGVPAGLSELSRLLASFERQDSAAAGLSEASSPSVDLAAAESAALRASEAGSVLPEALGRDSLGSELSDVSSLMAFLASSEDLATALGERSLLLISSRGTEVLAVAASELASADAALASADAMRLGVQEAQADLLIALSSAESVPATLSELAAGILVLLDRTESVALVLTDLGFQVDVTPGAPLEILGQDSLPAVLLEAGTVAVVLATGDVVAARLDELASVVVALSGQDTIFITAAEASALFANRPLSGFKETDVALLSQARALRLLASARSLRTVEEGREARKTD